MSIIDQLTKEFDYGTDKALFSKMSLLLTQSKAGNALFSNDAQLLLKAVIYTLVELRDQRELRLSARTINEYLSLDKILALAGRNDLTRASADSLRDFLVSIGWQWNKGEHSQPENLSERFGYARSYFGEPMRDLLSAYDSSLLELSAYQPSILDDISSDHPMIAL